MCLSSLNERCVLLCTTRCFILMGRECTVFCLELGGLREVSMPSIHVDEDSPMVQTVNEALAQAARLGYPVRIFPAYAVRDPATVPPVANNKEEMRRVAYAGFTGRAG